MRSRPRRNRSANIGGGEIIAKRMTVTKGDELIDSAIRDLTTKLH